MQVRVGGLRPVKDAAKIDVEAGVNFRLFKLSNRAACTNAGVVEHNVDAATSGLGGCLKRCIPCVAVAYIEQLGKLGIPCDEVQRLFKPRRIHVGDGYEPTLVREVNCNRAANARGTAGDENVTLHL